MDFTVGMRERVGAGVVVVVLRDPSPGPPPPPHPPPPVPPESRHVFEQLDCASCEADPDDQDGSLAPRGGAHGAV